jgi:hypothetical protein
MDSNITMFKKLDKTFQIAILRRINQQQVLLGNSQMTFEEFEKLPNGIQNMLLESEQLFSMVLSLIYTRMVAKADRYKKLTYRQFANFVVSEIFGEGSLQHKTGLSAPEQMKIRNDILKIWKTKL